MGGYGSGRWGSHTRKTTVEQCHTVNLARLERAGLFRHLATNTVNGSLQWANPSTGQVAAAVGFILESTDNAIVLTLAYRIRDEDMHIPVQIQTTTPNFGGTRYWGTCPDCRRRVRKLHLPPGQCQFSCRKCLGLSYHSVQEAHNLDGLNRLITERSGVPFEVVKAASRRCR
jgi:hypothetical protein